MKRMLCLLIALILILSGCSKAEDFEIKEFSYEEDYSYYKDDPGLKRSDFRNTEKCDIKTVEQAVELAKKECNVEHDSIAVAFDDELHIYRISFYKEGWDGGNQEVYLGQDGITLMIVSGE